MGKSLLKVMLPLSVRVLPLPEESIAGFAASNFQKATAAFATTVKVALELVTDAAPEAESRTSNWAELSFRVGDGRV